MKIVLQRSKEASVKVDGKKIAEISSGLVLLVGITHSDTEKDVDYLVDKIPNLRIFEDSEEKMNFSLLDVGGDILSVSQFTLYGDSKKGRRPNFMQAAKPDYAEELYHLFNLKLKNKGINVQTGSFGAMMDVSLVNDGPVTLIIES